MRILALVAVIAGLVGCTPEPEPWRSCNGDPSLCGLSFDRVTLPSTHNSMSNRDDGWIAPNQQHGIGQQLADGVRGMMLDTHYRGDAAFLCHADCDLGSLSLVQGLHTITTFLQEHPDEVLAIIFQDGISPEDNAAAFSDSGLDAFVYTHDGGDWPTLGEMIDDDARLVVGAEAQGPPPDWYHHAWDLWFDTPYSFDSIEAFTCALNRGQADNPLFLVNHWVSDPLSTEDNAEVANASDVLLARAEACAAEQDHPINLLAVDHYAVGDLFAVADALNGIEPE
jgi:hypothetical protein